MKIDVYFQQRTSSIFSHFCIINKQKIYKAVVHIEIRFFLIQKRTYIKMLLTLTQTLINVLFSVDAINPILKLDFIPAQISLIDE